jgi:hypothetical protein
MEALNSASLGAMGSLLTKLHEVLHNVDRAPIIGQLIEDVGSISTELVKLSDVHDPPFTVNYWMKEARELSYDMEDCVDQFVDLAESESESDAQMALVDEILGFRTRVEEVMERYHRFKLGYVHSSRPTVTNTTVNPVALSSHPTCPRLEMTSEDLNPVALVGVECPLNELLGWLKPNNGGDESELQLTVVSIFGVEGVGKSAIVQKLWFLAGEFECRAFVHVAKKPNMRLILRNILLQIRPNHPPEVCRVPNLIQDITRHLQDKRYFLGSHITLYMHSWLSKIRGFFLTVS